MPPLTIEVGIALALITGLVKVTSTVNRIEQQQQIGHTELIGKIEVVKQQITTVEKDLDSMKLDLKDQRRHRYSDINP